MKQYRELCERILNEGQYRDDRTGVGCYSVFGHQSRYDLSRGFPLLTLKKTHFKSIAVELLWFLRGDTNVKFLHEHGVTIWDEWADERGDLGPVYGKQWRSWEAFDADDRTWFRVDQIKNVIESIKTNPFSRRHIVSAWNPAEVDEMALPPCHTMFQFYVDYSPSGHKRLNCQLYQRSADVFLGVPFNIASYALLTEMIAHVTGMAPGEFVHTIGDAHLYANHITQTHEMLARREFPLPGVRLNTGVRDIDSFTLDDIHLFSYNSHPAIKAEVAV